MWVKFIADFDFSPAVLNGMSTTAYKAGMVENVTRECADAAVTAGKAKKIKAPRRGEAHGPEAEREQPV